MKNLLSILTIAIILGGIFLNGSVFGQSVSDSNAITIDTIKVAKKKKKVEEVTDFHKNLSEFAKEKSKFTINSKKINLMDTTLFEKFSADTSFTAKSYSDFFNNWIGDSITMYQKDKNTEFMRISRTNVDFLVKRIELAENESFSIARLQINGELDDTMLILYEKEGTCFYSEYYVNDIPMDIWLWWAGERIYIQTIHGDKIYNLNMIKWYEHTEAYIVNEIVVEDLYERVPGNKKAIAKIETASNKIINNLEKIID